MLFWPNSPYQLWIPRRCSTSKRLLSSLAATAVAAEEEQELVSASSPSDSQSSLRKFVSLFKPEAESTVPCQFGREGFGRQGAPKEKEMVSRPGLYENRRVRRLEVCHALAREGRWKEMRNALRGMVHDEGAGSAPLFCERLWTHFRHLDSNSIVWDTLANAYARSEMIDDARFVLSKMASLNMQASVSTYRSLLYRARYTGIVLDLYREIKASGISCGEKTIDLLIDGLCKQGRVQDAISFFQEIREEKSFCPCLITFNSLISGVCNSGFIKIAWKCGGSFGTI